MAKKILLVLALGMWLAGCGNDSLEAVYVTEADSGQAIGLQVGQELYVTLSDRPATALVWRVQCTPDDVLAEVGEPESYQDQPDTPGSGGDKRFRFSAVRSGEAMLEFEYLVPFEPEDPPRKTAMYSVIVF